MPPISENNLDDDAVLWPFLRADKNGRPLVGPPESLACKLTFTRSQTRDPAGNVIDLAGRMATADPIPVGSLVWPGKAEDMPAGTSFTDEDDGLYQVFGEDGRGSGPARWDADGRVYTLTRWGRSLPREVPR